MDVSPGAVKTRINLVCAFFRGMEEVFSDAGAHVLNELAVVGCSHNVFRGVGHSRGTAHQRGCEALGAILIKRAGEIDGRSSFGEVEAVVDQSSCFAVRQFTDELCPARIIISGFCQIACLQRACNADCRHGGIGIVFRFHLFHDGYMAFFGIDQAIRPHLFGNFQRLRGGPGALPVIAAEVSDRLAAIAGILVQVGIVKEIGDRVACFGRDGICMILGGIGPL